MIKKIQNPKITSENKFSAPKQVQVQPPKQIKKICRYCGKETAGEDICPNCKYLLLKVKNEITVEEELKREVKKEVLAEKTSNVEQEYSTIKPTPKTSMPPIKISYHIAGVFMIFMSAVLALALIPLLWTIPMIKSYYCNVYSRKRISVGFSFCVFLFISRIAGLILLCSNDD